MLTSTTTAWTEDLTKCNVGRSFGLAEYYCSVSGPSIVEMVASTQRTNNTAGYALKQKSWTELTPDTSIDAVYLNLTLQTPILSAGNIIQFYASFDFPERVDTTSNIKSYDTVMCSFQYHGTDNLDNYKYEVHDYYTTSIPFDLTTGNYGSMDASLDTVLGGTEDWVLEEKMSSKTCYQSYCEFICVVSRPLSSEDAGFDT